MQKIAILMLALCLLSASAAFAKRGAPKIVPPIRSGEVEFRAPHSQMGCVQAWDVKRDQLIWQRQIYVVRYNLDLERDVQDTFIQSMELKGDSLLITNERKSEYRLDLDSLDVTVVKGALVEGRK